MQVDYNNLRVQLANEYNTLIHNLNGSIDANGRLEIDTYYIQRSMDSIRNMIATLCCCYQEDNPDCKSVIDEVGTLLSLKNADEN